MEGKSCSSIEYKVVGFRFLVPMSWVYSLGKNLYDNKCSIEIVCCVTQKYLAINQILLIERKQEWVSE